MMQSPVVARGRTSAEAAIASAAVAGVAASLLVAPDLRGAAGALLAIVMLAIAVIDARRFIIPDGLNAAGFGLALLHAAIQSPSAVLEAITAAALRGAVLALLFLGLRVGYRRLRGREGIGLGDVKLACVAGAWLDWSIMPIAIETAALAALTVHMVRQHALGRSFQPTSRLPFGLFFAPAIWPGWLIETTALVPADLAGMSLF
jgi:leader peptidase (prepilin peptidase)/N-methyltransferase